MSQKILLDSGIIVAFCSKNPPKKITQLFLKIASNDYVATLVISQISEIAYHLSKFYNKETIRQLIYSIIDKYQLQIVDPSVDLSLEAGLLRKDYPSLLSYVDCVLLLMCKHERLIFHTTEKRLTEFLRVDFANQLKIVKYAFD